MSNCISLCSSACECLNAVGVPAAVAAEFRFFVQDNWFFLKTAKENLQAVRTVVNTKVAREIDRQRGVNPQVQLWFSRVEDIIMDKSLEEEYDKLMLCGCNLSRRCKLRKRIIKKLQYVKGLIEEEKQFTDVSVDLPVGVVNMIPVVKTFGMESMLIKQLHEYFEDHERCIIGVWGPAGFGKTTLNVFNNQITDCSDFHAVILIDVSNSEILSVN